MNDITKNMNKYTLSISFPRNICYMCVSYNSLHKLFIQNMHIPVLARYCWECPSKMTESKFLCIGNL